MATYKQKNWTYFEGAVAMPVVFKSVSQKIHAEDIESRIVLSDLGYRSPSALTKKTVYAHKTN